MYSYAYNDLPSRSSNANLRLFRWKKDKDGNILKNELGGDTDRFSIEKREWIPLNHADGLALDEYPNMCSAAEAYELIIAMVYEGASTCFVKHDEYGDPIIKRYFKDE